MASDFVPVFADLVRAFTTGEGVGPVLPGAAVSGHRGFEGIAAGECFYYSMASITVPAEWEVGRGTMLPDGRVAREPLSSSSGGALVNFSVGAKTIALTVAADFFERMRDRAEATPLGLADGGTGAADAAGARANLGLVPGTDVMGYDSGLAAIAVSETTSFGRAHLGLADAAALRGHAGLGTVARKNLGTAGDAVPVLNGGAATWSSGADFGGGLVARGPSLVTSTAHWADGQSAVLNFGDGSHGVDLAGGGMPPGTTTTASFSRTATARRLR